jgi:hypothetical protein
MSAVYAASGPLRSSSEKLYSVPLKRHKTLIHGWDTDVEED